MSQEGLYAVTLWQPWADFIAQGLKRLETRSWPLGHTGTMYIHASRRWTPEQQELAAKIKGPSYRPALGVIVCRVRVLGCVKYEVGMREVCGVPITTEEAQLGDIRPGRWLWVLGDVVATPPVPCRGFQGIWRVPDTVAERFKEESGMETEQVAVEANKP